MRKLVFAVLLFVSLCSFAKTMLHDGPDPVPIKCDPVTGAGCSR